MKRNSDDTRLAPTLLRLAVAGVYLVAAGLGYAWLNRLGSASPRALVFEAPTAAFPWLYQPWTAVVYVVAGSLLPLLPLLWIRQRKALAQILASYVLGTAVLFAFFAAVPVRMTRRSYDGPGLGETMMRWVVGLDAPANCFPSAHCFFAVAAALLVTKFSPALWVTGLTWLTATAVLISTVTVGQHYFIDVVGGVMVAVLSVTAVHHYGRFTGPR